MIKYVITILVVFAFGLRCDGFEDCGSELGELIKLTVSGCEDLEKRCILHRNENSTLTMEFNLQNDTIEVKSVVHGVILGVPIPFAIPNPDGCFESGLSCPLKEGGPYTYTATLPVQKKYPKVTVDVKWQLEDENGNVILCLLIPSKIQ